MGTLFNGYRELGQDDNVFSFDGPLDLTPSGSVAILNYGVNIINFSGAVASGVGNINAVLPSGIENNISFLYVRNLASGTVTVSGAATNYTINGQTSYQIPAGGNVHLFNYSGTNGGNTINYITL